MNRRLLQFFFVCQCCRAQCDRIFLLQGRGKTSPCAAQTVAVTGVVTASLPPLNGFFLQDPAGDDDRDTSDGIFVFTGVPTNLPEPGNLLRVSGRVVEFARQGNPGSVTEIDVRGTGSVSFVGASPIPLPVPLDPPRDAGAYLESREGMLIVYPDSAVVQPSNRFGEFFVLRYDRVPAFVRPTTDDPGGGAPLTIAGRREAKSYDLIPSLIGVLHFDFGTFRLEPVVPFEISDAGWTPTAAPPGGPPSVRIASMNCERLTRALSPAALERKLDKLALAVREHLDAPDILAVAEVEDRQLLESLGARAGRYEAALLSGCDFSRINVGVLYNPARLRKLSERQLQAEAPEFRNGHCALPDGRAFDQFLFDRPPLIVEFALGATSLTIVVNHWRSRIGGNEAERLAGARLLASEIRRISAANIIVAGDFNDDESAAAVRALTEETGLTNLSFRVPLWQRYSLIFEGRSEALDHILVSPSVAPRITAAGFAHYNADFPVTWGDLTGTAVRAADHDAAWAHWRP